MDLLALFPLNVQEAVTQIAQFPLPVQSVRPAHNLIKSGVFSQPRDPEIVTTAHPQTGDLPTEPSQEPGIILLTLDPSQGNLNPGTKMAVSQDPVSMETRKSREVEMPHNRLQVNSPAEATLLVPTVLPLSRLRRRNLLRDRWALTQHCSLPISILTLPGILRVSQIEAVPVPDTSLNLRRKEEDAIPPLPPLSSSDGSRHRHKRHHQSDPVAFPTEALSQLVSLLSQSVERLATPASASSPGSGPSSATPPASQPSQEPTDEPMTGAIVLPDETESLQDREEGQFPVDPGADSGDSEDDIPLMDTAISKEALEKAVAVTRKQLGFDNAPQPESSSSEKSTFLSINRPLLKMQLCPWTPSALTASISKLK